MALTSDYIVSSLKALYGTTLTSGDVKGWCAAGGPSYQTVTKHLEPFKTGRGRS